MAAEGHPPGRRFTRRTLLKGAAGLAAAIVAPRPAPADAGRRIEILPARQPIVGPPHPDTAVWSYAGQVPGPEIRLRQGERLSVVAGNRLPVETTIHWHGIRLPNAMDGVPHLTQPPIEPGASFAYSFDLPDAGTYWYHPHLRSLEQVERGLAGALIVEEPEPIAVDRDVTWLLDDWRLTNGARIAGDFGNFMDASHAGRLGNTVTINGRVTDSFAVRSGERLRLRLINAANARIFALAFTGHRPRVIALDGQPVEPHEPADERVVLGPAMRADLVLDMTGEPGARATVIDGFYPQQTYRLVELAYGSEPPLRRRPSDTPIALAANPVAEPDLADAARIEVRFGGGMMGHLEHATLDGQPVDAGEMMRNGMAWTINGVAVSGHVMEPFVTLPRGRSAVLAMANETAWHHPIHLHGHAFRVIARNGRPTRYREWRDTVLVAPRERVDIAFVADNPGDWMLHCHILEHQAAGMMAVLRVS